VIPFTNKRFCFPARFLSRDSECEGKRGTARESEGKRGKARGKGGESEGKQGESEGKVNGAVGSFQFSALRRFR
jgi:hypothetical protein